ncbi:MAG: site-2 protease family protein [Haliscomenobacter sp.]|nr:site-2 protease family protein [Haliscomenobacter sp.]MBP9076231.1 site-2 protease family protein [Haliscomenobacter sp.]MBP9872809.1 site-2 protease family protein [Haliscomenobacter sp.]
MKWSLRIARISGIDVYLHWTFILLLAWMGISLFNAGKEGWNYFGLVLLLFVFVLLHEFGHALVGQRFGVKTDRITLLPIGGVASMERMPEKPWQEFWIAIAGPLVNLFLAACIGIYFVASGQEVEGLNAVSSLSGNFASDLLAVNLTLFAFNLIPAFPMDGGRILRALLSLKYDRLKATNIAARIGQVLAIGFVFASFYLNIWLMFIGIFIYLGAGAEASYESTHSALSRFKVRDALMRQHTVLDKHCTIAEAVSRLLDGQEKEFLVSDNGEVIGSVTRDELISGIEKIGKEGSMGQIANPNLVILHPETALEDVFLMMNQKKVEICPVFEEDQLIGVVNRENIIELLMVNNALRQNVALTKTISKA